jgi:hypothetical protein
VARSIDPEDERRKACVLALEELIRQHGSPLKVEKAIPTLKQPTINKFQKHGSLGLELADAIAAAHDTTVDGLVWLFLKGGAGAVLARNVPGWHKAVEEATSRWGDYPYDLAGATLLPVAPRVATPDFVRDLARLFSDHVRTSSVRPAVRKANV